ncbi:hypothetical protein K6L59_03065 [Candidatus Phytoplasma sp. Tabriz.2]|nr:hypothetical protein [Candidatus Phytoplasma australiense]
MTYKVLFSTTHSTFDEELMAVDSLICNQFCLIYIYIYIYIYDLSLCIL